MPIDSSIYQNLKPLEMPSMLDSQTKAMNLRGLAMQQNQMAKESEAFDRDSKTKALLQKASMFGNALESMSGLSEQERAAMYPKARQELIGAGIMGEQDAPADYDPIFYNGNLRKYRMSRDGIEQQLKMAQIGEIKAKTAKDNALARGKGMVDPVTGQVVIGQKMLPADKVLSVNEGKQIPRMLEDISGTIGANVDSFGPISGRLSAMNPYNEKAATIDAQMRAGSQAFGRFMEGGVLRKEDEEKYRKMFPQLSDTPEVAKNKLAIVDRLLKSKSAADVQALSASGYDTRAFRGMDAAIPEVPATLRGGGSGGIIPSAMADGRGPSQPSGVRMIGPDGKVRVVPESMVGEAIAAGGKRAK